MLHWGVEEGHYTHKLLKKKKIAIAKGGRAVYWRKQKGHHSRRTLNKQSLQG
jgi:hypothetical protein